MTLLPEPRIRRSAHLERQTPFALAQAARAEENFNAAVVRSMTRIGDATAETVKTMSQTVTRVATMFDIVTLAALAGKKGKTARLDRKHARIRLRRTKRTTLQQAQPSWTRR